MEIPAPGDLRKCLVALAEGSSVWPKAFEYRFEAGELSGHALGNLIIGGLAAASGDLLAALAEAEKLVGAVGRVLPAALSPVRLAGAARGGQVVGQAAVSKSAGIATISLLPAAPEAPSEAVEAILDAEQVVLGPGSLYTSVLAVLAVPALQKAVEETSARVVYVSNLRPQVPETDGYDVAAHVAALALHGVHPDVVLCDSSALPLGDVEVPVCDRSLMQGSSERHDVKQLARALAELAW